MNCHDIRYFVICKGCHDVGDKRHMIPTDMAWFHGRCYVTEFGEERFLTLPRSHTGPITLDDIGMDLMRKLLDQQPSSADAR